MKERELRERVRELEVDIESWRRVVGRLQGQYSSLWGEYDALREAAQIVVEWYANLTDDEGKRVPMIPAIDNLQDELTESGGGCEASQGEARRGESREKKPVKELSVKPAASTNRPAACDDTPKPPQNGGIGKHIGKLLVSDGVPWRSHGKVETSCMVREDWLPLTDSPDDLPYKLAWEAGECPIIAGCVYPRRDWPDGLYDVWRVGECEPCDGKGYTITHQKDKATCPTCRGNGGRYEMRAKDKEVTP